jgi:ribonuclease HI
MPTGLHADIWFDGACRRNPFGPGGGGAHIEFPGTSLGPVRVYRPLPRCTNNEAEYTGLIIGLAQARSEGATSVYIRGDSKLVIGHLDRSYRMKSKRLRPYFDEVRRLLQGFDVRGLEWIPRARNGKADRASRGLDTIRL